MPGGAAAAFQAAGLPAARSAASAAHHAAHCSGVPQCVSMTALVCVFGMATSRCAEHVDGRSVAWLEASMSRIKMRLRVNHRRSGTNSLTPEHGIGDGNPII